MTVDGTILRLECLRVASSLLGPKALFEDIKKLARECETFAWAGLQPLPYRDNSVKCLLVDLEASLRQEISGRDDENEIIKIFTELKSKFISE